MVVMTAAQNFLLAPPFLSVSDSDQKKLLGEQPAEIEPSQSTYLASRGAPHLLLHYTLVLFWHINNISIYIHIHRRIQDFVGGGARPPWPPLDPRLTIVLP